MINNWQQNEGTPDGTKVLPVDVRYNITHFVATGEGEGLASGATDKEGQKIIDLEEDYDER